MLHFSSEKLVFTPFIFHYFSEISRFQFLHPNFRDIKQSKLHNFFNLSNFTWTMKKQQNARVNHLFKSRVEQKFWNFQILSLTLLECKRAIHIQFSYPSWRTIFCVNKNRKLESSTIKIPPSREMSGKYFDFIHYTLLWAAESSGNLANVLGYFSDHNRKHKTRTKLSCRA